jgi:hypothetical protein
MKPFARSRSRSGARVFLGLLGILLAMGIAILGDAAIFTEANRSCASAAGAMVPRGADQGRVMRSTGAADCTAEGRVVRLVAESVLAMQVNPQLGGFLLMGCGIGGFVYLAVRRRKTGEHETRA